jgi:hypothetical protein
MKNKYKEDRQTEDMKKELEDKIREAVPEKKPVEVMGVTCTYSFQELNLQDVLIALSLWQGDRNMAEGIELMLGSSKNSMWIENCYGGLHYYLHKNYHEQSPEFYSFLHQLLCDK